MKKVILCFCLGLIVVGIYHFRIRVTSTYFTAYSVIDNHIGFEVLDTVYFNPNGTVDSVKVKNEYSLVRNAGSERLRRKIYFLKENTGYHWSAYGPFRKIKSLKNEKILQPGKWYRLWGIMKWWSPTYSVVIRVHENGDFETFHEYNPGPF